jgi:hypothetical protein
MKLASSSYYYQPVTDIETKQFSDTLLRDHIERLQQDFPDTVIGAWADSCAVKGS